MNNETRKLKNLVRSNVSFKTTTTSNNGTTNRLKEGIYSTNAPNAWNRAINTARRRSRTLRTPRHYNANAARRAGEAYHRAATRNTNIMNEMRREFIRNNYTPAEQEVYMTAIERYGPFDRYRIERHIRHSALSNNSKRRLTNVMHSDRIQQRLFSEARPQYIHSEWIPHTEG